MKRPRATKWTPKIGDKYWYITTGGYLARTDWLGIKVDKASKAAGNCFRTQEEAQRAKTEELL